MINFFLRRKKAGAKSSKLESAKTANDQAELAELQQKSIVDIDRIRKNIHNSFFANKKIKSEEAESAPLNETLFDFSGDLTQPYSRPVSPTPLPPASSQASSRKVDTQEQARPKRKGLFSPKTLKVPPASVPPKSTPSPQPERSTNLTNTKTTTSAPPQNIAAASGANPMTTVSLSSKKTELPKSDQSKSSKDDPASAEPQKQRQTKKQASPPPSVKPQTTLKKGSWLMLGFGFFVFVLGIYRYFDNPSLNKNKMVVDDQQISVQPSRQSWSENIDTVLMHEVFPKTWTLFSDRLEAKHYTIERSEALHPRLQLLELEKGVELTLLLTEQEKHIIEVSLRIHLLDTSNALMMYRQLLADLQEILADGVIKNDTQFFSQLNLPENFYAVPLPYVKRVERFPVIAKLEILDPIYLVLHFMPYRYMEVGKRD